MARRRKSAAPAPRDEGPPLLELAFGALGAVFAAALLGIILWNGVFGAGSPPDIVVTIDGVHTASGGLAARFTARNRGGETASQVEIEGRLGDAAATTTFDFIPAGSKRSGTLVFPAAAGAHGEIAVRVLGYREP